MQKNERQGVLLSWFRLFLRDTYPDYGIEVEELPASKRVRVRMSLGTSTWSFEPVLAQIVQVDNDPALKELFLEQIAQLLSKDPIIVPEGDVSGLE